ncbi:MAG TPA: c-type cytochrome [Hyphomicrobium sp.]|jgi:mono/diheme cytochrome c family protein
MRLTPTLTGVVLILFPIAAAAQELGTPGLGHEYAVRVCAECHDVEAKGEISPNPDAPSFQQVADTPGMSARALAVWMQTSHPTMPDLIIKPEDMDNVIAYIMSLRTPK